jgi:hypothetical protein
VERETGRERCDLIRLDRPGEGGSERWIDFRGVRKEVEG